VELAVARWPTWAITRRGQPRTAAAAWISRAARRPGSTPKAGDEPFIALLPCQNAAPTKRGGALARARFGVSAIVLDDGFQHRTVRKDLEIVMARASAPWGNGRLLPGGPLREPLSGLRRANLVVATGAHGAAEAGEIAAALARHAPGVPLVTAMHVATECFEAGAMRFVPLSALDGSRLLAFAGIASPAGFRRTLGESRVALTGFQEFRDHHWYSREDLARLEGLAASGGADGLVTTEKDWVRLRRLPPLRRPLYVLSVRLQLTSGEQAWRDAFARLRPR
jgi:tetraacyldisaccharide 4'-kinase